MNSNSIMYDSLYGGLVTHNSINDPLHDQAFGWYNKHVNCWGYWIYASAVILHLDPLWAKQPDYIEAVMSIIHDIANSSYNNEHFPQFRSMNFYLGRSQIDGLDKQALSFNNSEIINSYYSIFLYGQALYDNHISYGIDILNIGRSLCNIEISNSIFNYNFLSVALPDVIDYTSLSFSTNIPYISFVKHLFPLSCVSLFIFTPDWVLKHKSMIKFYIDILSVSDNPHSEYLPFFLFLYCFIDKKWSINSLTSIANNPKYVHPSVSFCYLLYLYSSFPN